MAYETLGKGRIFGKQYILDHIRVPAPVNTPHILLLYGTCRSGTSAFLKSISKSEQVRSAFYQPLKTLLRQGGPEFILPESNEEYVCVKETLGAWTEEECLLDPLDLLLSAGVPHEKITAIALVRNPFHTFNSWKELYDGTSLACFNQAFMNAIHIFASAKQKGVRAIPFVYEMLEDDADFMLDSFFQKIGLGSGRLLRNWTDRQYGDGIVMPQEASSAIYQDTMGRVVKEGGIVFKVGRTDRLSVAEIESIARDLMPLYDEHRREVEQLFVGKYEFNGDEYRTKASSPQRDFGKRTIADLADRLSGNEEILDIGCGDGFLSSLLSELVPSGKVTGIDQSQGMIRAAKRFEKYNLRFLLKSIDEITDIEAYDVVFSNAALHWYKDHNKLFEICYRALKQGGILRYEIPSAKNYEYSLQAVREAVSHARFSAWFENFEFPWYLPDEREYRAILENSRFSTFDLSIHYREVVFKDSDELKMWYTTFLVPFLKEIENDSEKNDFQKLASDNFIAKAIQADGSYKERHWRINVLAKKSLACPVHMPQVMNDQTLWIFSVLAASS